MEPTFVGEIALFAGQFAARQWAACNGAALQIDKYSKLYSIIGYTYTPEDDRDKGIFKIPDLRARAVVGEGLGPGLNAYPLGLTGGAETVTLTDSTMPSHKHAISGTLNFNNALGDERVPLETSLALSTEQIYSADGPIVGTSFAQGTVTAFASSVGESAPFSNRDPYLALTFKIALTL